MLRPLAETGQRCFMLATTTHMTSVYMVTWSHGSAARLTGRVEAGTPESNICATRSTEAVNYSTV